MKNKIVVITLFIILIIPCFSVFGFSDKTNYENIITNETESVNHHIISVLDKYSTNALKIMQNNEEGWQYDQNTGQWCTEFPAILLNFSLIWELEIPGVYELFLTFIHDYDFNYYYYFDGSSGQEFEYEAFGYLEISSDNGNNWDILDIFNGTGSGSEYYNISIWTGDTIFIRFRCIGTGDTYFSSNPGGSWCFWNLRITGMQDDTPPVSTINITGTLWETDWYSSSVVVRINASDYESGVKEIHYILDDQETAIFGDNVEFTISESGVHKLEYWAIDNAGNVEVKKTLPFLKIDKSPPTVSITGPEKGLYLFGNKLINLNQIIIIGTFIVEANADDSESGILRLQFFLDDELFQEDTESPFQVYCMEKHMGSGIIKVVAEDLVHNTAEDLLSVTYYKFF